MIRNVLFKRKVGNLINLYCKLQVASYKLQVAGAGATP
jgi:hypothetical protein